MTRQLQKITVFQESGSGEKKLFGLRKYGHSIDLGNIFNINADLPAVIDSPRTYLPSDFNSDLVISFLKHPDLVDCLAGICHEKGIPVIATGQKINHAITPLCCCGLGRLPGLGPYGEQFGIPELEISVENDRIAEIKVKRGSPCGSTWLAAERITGVEVSRAVSAYAREVQYHCAADPANFDPVTGKSSLHHAGDVHAAALKNALDGLAISN